MQMLSSEICEIFKNNSFTKHPGGYFCRQNRSKETKRYTKKQYSANIFIET